MEKEHVKVEAYLKRTGGRLYRQVLFFVGGKCIVVDDILCKDDTTAYKIACKYLRMALEL